MDQIHKLTELFRQFPGIGPRQAKRFVYFLLTSPDSYTKEISLYIEGLKKEIISCSDCFRFFPKDHSTTCYICRDTHRDKKTLMVVARDIDLENIEKSRVFDGLYFVLGSTIPVLEKNPEKKIRQQELLRRIEALSVSGLKEIIVAFDYNPEGEHTREYIEEILTIFIKEKNIKLTHLGRGLSLGSELEYVDNDTIKNALKNRI